MNAVKCKALLIGKLNVGHVLDGQYEAGYSAGYAAGYAAGYEAGRNDYQPDITTSVLGRAIIGTMILEG